MEILKTVLGDTLYGQVVQKIDAYNEDPQNTQKIKLGNLGNGDYVAKGKYEALETALTGKNEELVTANGLIAELKKGSRGNEALQGKIAEYENTLNALQAQLAETKLKAAIRFALMEEKALDVDYLTFKLQSKLKDEGRTLELDDNGNIKGWKDLSEGLKIQFPHQFEGGAAGRVIQEHKLDTGSGEKALSRSDILKMPYAERVKLYEENKEGYEQAMKG